MNKPLLTVNQLRVQIETPRGVIQPVDEVSFTLHKGEIFALVGESGCGKSMTALSLNRLLPNNAYMCEGSEVWLDDAPLHRMPENEMRRIRAKKIGMIFQDPALALNPVLTIGEQLIEVFRQSNGNLQRRSDLNKAAIGMLEKVRIPEPQLFLRYYPHQLSGGMKQRIVIAMALAKSPDILIADEPTTALDVTTQAQVLSLIKDLNKESNMAILLITHDLGIVGQIADTVAVMYAGHIVEQSTKTAYFASAKHPYSKKLFAAIPELTDHSHELAIIPGQVPLLSQAFHLCRFRGRCAVVFKPCEERKPEFISVNQEQKVRCHWYDEKSLKQIPTPLRIENIESFSVSNALIKESHTFSESEAQPVVLEVKKLKVHFPIRRGFFKRKVGAVKAVDNLSFDLAEGETLALVGESGCGKTTAGKAILRLIESTDGQVNFDKQNIFKFSSKKLRSYRSRFQMIFQDPYASMDPRMMIKDILEEGMLALKIGTDKAEREDRIRVLLEQVGLPFTIQERYPHELSGGQRQRVAIARALAVGAELIVCDEPTSALDLSVQAQILNLLRSLQNDLSISYLFITHNIGVVHYLADTVAVMYLGRIIEYGSVQDVLHTPKHPYTIALLDSVPSLDKANVSFKPVEGEIPSPSNPPVGCHFSPRCPKAHARCFGEYPDRYAIDNKHWVTCYLYSPEEREGSNEKRLLSSCEYNAQ